MILDIRKALADELHDFVLCLGFGLVHHIITLGHFELIMMMHYRVGPVIPLRHTE